MNLNLEISLKSKKLEEKTLAIPLQTVSSRMLKVFEWDVLSKLNNQC